ncbi:hypothetical protein DH09_19845 [Bacillaceae bacterium JMAK1]|nr:hypothetical protein DH09_19845 [Bacillaceae bacterium JMAK1]
MFRKVGSSVVTLMLFGLLMGCASDTDSEEVSEGASEEGGELNVAYGVQPPSLDPHSVTDVSTRDISQHMFEPLVTLNSSLEVEPMLADSFEVNEDEETVTFYLREGIQFHNGDEMTARDVIASMERWHDYSSQAQEYLDGTEYEAIDDYTVVAHLEEYTTIDMFIFADMTQFAAIMPEEVITNAGTNLVDELIGTGPFQLEEWRQDQFIHFKKFEEYQSREEPADGLSGAKEPKVDDIYFHHVGDASTRVSGIQSGEYDIATAIPQDNAEMLESNPDLHNELISSSYPALIFNKAEGIFTEQAARQAVNAAVDTEDMLLAAYGSEEFYINDHSLVQEEQEGWYSEAGSDVHATFDLDLAEELLEESGYDGEEIVILASREVPDEYNMTIVLQQQLEAIGMNVDLQVSDRATVLDVRDDSEVWDITFSPFAFRPMPVQYLYLNSGYHGWTDSEELSQLTEDILYAGTPEDAQAYADEFHEAFWDYLPVLKPGNKIDIVSMRDGIEGYQHITGPILWNVSVND